MKKSKQAAGLALVSATALLGGCSLFVPYDQTFMCQKTDDYGRCTDVRGAYRDALASGDGGDTQTRQATNYVARSPAGFGEGVPGQQVLVPTTQDRDPAHPRKPVDVKPADVRVVSVADTYRDSEYRELARLIDEPVTPIVRPPKVLRTLIMSYQSGGDLYMPRYVFYIADQSRFVLGDYLAPVTKQQVLYPNGGSPNGGTK